MKVSDPPLAMEFYRGTTAFEIVKADEGSGYVGRRNGKIRAVAPDAPSVARALILSERWSR